MQKKGGAFDPARRALLTTMAVATGGAATVAVGAVKGPATTVTPAASGTTAPSAGGYRETEHVRNYYRTARL